MKKCRILALIFVCGISLGLSQCGEKKEQVEQAKNVSAISEDTVIEGEPKAEDVIKKSVELMNEKKEAELRNCYTKRNNENDFRLDNLKSIKLQEISLIKDKNQYKFYMDEFWQDKYTKDLKINDVKLYKVKYVTEYVKDEKEPVKSGEASKTYCVIKDEDGFWRIHDIGDAS